MTYINEIQDFFVADLRKICLDIYFIPFLRPLAMLAERLSAHSILIKVYSGIAQFPCNSTAFVNILTCHDAEENQEVELKYVAFASPHPWI